MTPQEKARDLFNKYYYLFPEKRRIDFGYTEAKQCALIAVDEIFIVCNREIINCSDKTYFYWQEVKTEIERL